MASWHLVEGGGGLCNSIDRVTCQRIAASFGGTTFFEQMIHARTEMCRSSRILLRVRHTDGGLESTDDTRMKPREHIIASPWESDCAVLESVLELDPSLELEQGRAGRNLSLRD